MDASSPRMKELLKALEATHGEEISSAHASHGKAMADLELATSEKLASLHEAFQTTLDSTRKAHGESEPKRHKSTATAIRRHEKALKNHAEELTASEAALTLAHGEEVQAIEEAHRKDALLLQEKHAASLSALRRRHRSEVKTLQENPTTSEGNGERSLVAAAQQDLEAATEDVRRSLENFPMEARELLAEAQYHASKALGEAQAEASRKIAAKELELETLRSSYELKLASLASENAQASERAALAEASLAVEKQEGNEIPIPPSELESLREEATRKVVAAENLAKAQIATLTKDFALRVRAIEAAAEKQLARAISDSQAALARAQLEAQAKEATAEAALLARDEALSARDESAHGYEVKLREAEEHGQEQARNFETTLEEVQAKANHRLAEVQRVTGEKIAAAEALVETQLHIEQRAAEERMGELEETFSELLEREKKTLAADHEVRLQEVKAAQAKNYEEMLADERADARRAYEQLQTSTDEKIANLQKLLAKAQAAAGEETGSALDEAWGESEKLRNQQEKNHREELAELRRAHAKDLEHMQQAHGENIRRRSEALALMAREKDALEARDGSREAAWQADLTEAQLQDALRKQEILALQRQLAAYSKEQIHEIEPPQPLEEDATLSREVELLTNRLKQEKEAHGWDVQKLEESNARALAFAEEARSAVEAIETTYRIELVKASADESSPPPDHEATLTKLKEIEKSAEVRIKAAEVRASQAEGDLQRALARSEASRHELATVEATLRHTSAAMAGAMRDERARSLALNGELAPLRERVRQLEGLLAEARARGEGLAEECRLLRTQSEQLKTQAACASAALDHYRKLYDERETEGNIAHDTSL